MYVYKICFPRSPDHLFKHETLSRNIYENVYTQNPESSIYKNIYMLYMKGNYKKEKLYWWFEMNEIIVSMSIYDD